MDSKCVICYTYNDTLQSIDNRRIPQFRIEQFPPGVRYKHGNKYLHKTVYTICIISV